MTIEEVKNVTQQEAVTPATNAEATATQESQEPKEGSKEFNFRKLESEKKEVERRLREQEQSYKELVGAIKQNMQPQQQQSKEEILPELSPDDIPEWKHVKSYSEKIAEKKFKELTAQKEREMLPQIVKQRYQDFDQVVTAERIATLEKENPKLAEAFTKSSDPFTAVYSYFKAVHTAPKKVDPVAMEEAEKIMANEKKPISSNAVGGQQGVLKNANAFAKKSREDLYKEMMDAAARA